VTFSAVLSRAVTKTLDGLDRPTEQRIRSRVRQIADDPLDARLSKPLAYPKGYRSSRVGGWRIIFIVRVEESRIEILSVEPPGQVYRGL
jgi:mRNA interferase RelE/StbE